MARSRSQSFLDCLPVLTERDSGKVFHLLLIVVVGFGSDGQTGVAQEVCPLASLKRSA